MPVLAGTPRQPSRILSRFSVLKYSGVMHFHALVYERGPLYSYYLTGIYCRALPPATVFVYTVYVSGIVYTVYILWGVVVSGL